MMYIMILASKDVEVICSKLSKFSEFFFMKASVKEVDEESLAKNFVKSFMNLISQFTSPFFGKRKIIDFYQLRILRNEKLVI